MKKLTITILLSAICFFSIATDSNIEVSDDHFSTTIKTPAQILIGGSWNNPDAAMSEDVIFYENGSMLWRSGSDEGEGSWEVKGNDILNFYGNDYKIVKLTESKLVVSLNGETTNYNRNIVPACSPQFKVEGMNDAKGEYKIGNESWTIHFAENGFIAFYSKDGNQEDAISLQEIISISDCEYNIKMNGIQGKTAPQWTLIYNKTEKFYDLHVRSYDAKTGTWTEKVYGGSSDNG